MVVGKLRKVVDAFGKIINNVFDVFLFLFGELFKGVLNTFKS